MTRTEGERETPPDLRGVAGCRVVTVSASARLLLAGQLRNLREVRWTLVSGDEYPDAPPYVEVHHIPMARELAPSDLRSLVDLYRFFRGKRFSFVQTHTQKASMLALPAARCAGLETLYTMHGCLVFRDNSRAQNVLGWVFERWCCMWARRVLVQSREDAGTVPRARICPARKVVYIGNGIDLSRFELRPLPLTTGARPVVMMVSRLVAEKGCRDFFAVARALRSRARFVHVGPAEVDQRDAIGQREMDELSSAGIVEFWGPTEDVPGALAKADLLLHPSYREGIPRVPMEAAATGRPVAGYDIRGMREVVPADLGLLVPRGNKEALVEVVGSLLDDRDRLVDLGRACYEWVVANFSEDAVVERLRRVYADVADVKVPAS